MPKGIPFLHLCGTARLLSDVVIWRESAPSCFTFTCRSDKANAELRIWNCWKLPDEIQQAWVGNAGITTETNGNKVLLGCSTGVGEFDPTDLIAEVYF
jgi:hypothetical protein